MKKGKKIAITVSAMALSAAVAVGGTIAYLTSTTETLSNTFASTKNITTELTEGEWKEDSGQNYYPGKVLAKNPVMTNESNINVYIAIKVDYVGNDGNYMSAEEFGKYASVQDYNTTDWEKIAQNSDGSEIWMYKKAVGTADGSNKTTALFNSVKVNSGLTGEWSQKSHVQKVYKVDSEGNKELINTSTEVYDKNFKYYDEKGNEVTDAVKLPSFNINVTGFAVQESGIELEGTGDGTAVGELIKLVNSKVSEDKAF